MFPRADPHRGASLHTTWQAQQVAEHWTCAAERTRQLAYDPARTHPQPIRGGDQACSGRCPAGLESGLFAAGHGTRTFTPHELDQPPSSHPAPSGFRMAVLVWRSSSSPSIRSGSRGRGRICGVRWPLVLASRDGRDGAAAPIERPVGCRAVLCAARVVGWSGGRVVGWSLTAVLSRPTS